MTLIVIRHQLRDRASINLQEELEALLHVVIRLTSNRGVSLCHKLTPFPFLT